MFDKILQPFRKSNPPAQDTSHLGDHQIVTCFNSVSGPDGHLEGCGKFTEQAIKYFGKKNTWPYCPKCGKKTLSVIP